MIPALTSRFKIMSLNIAERRQPQTAIRRRYQGNTVDFRVSAPSRFGEKVCCGC